MRGVLAMGLLLILLGAFGWLGASKTTDPDEAVLEQLKKAGSDLSKPHKIEFYLYFPKETAAQKAAKQIKDLGFEVDVRRAAQGSDWLCFSVKTMIPELAALQKIRRDFNSLTASLGGEYDGWGTGVVK